MTSELFKILYLVKVYNLKGIETVERSEAMLLRDVIKEAVDLDNRVLLQKLYKLIKSSNYQEPMKTNYMDYINECIRISSYNSTITK